jgi:hypothetical protein
MRKINRFVGSLAVLTMVCALAPASFGKAAPSYAVITNSGSDPLSIILGILDPNRNRKTPPPPPSRQQNVPEGGSSLMYLGLAGFACIGTAMSVRARRKSALQPVR